MLGDVTIKNVKDALGALTRALREREGLTQEQLAEKLAISRLTIQNLERGKNVTIETILKVVQHFELLRSFNDFINTEVDNNSQKSLY